MFYRYFTTIFWLFFVLESRGFSNAAVPDWCDNPMPIKMTVMVYLHIDTINFGSREGKLVYLCQVNTNDTIEFQEELDGLYLFALWNPENEDTLFKFGTGDLIKFKLRCGNTFEFMVSKSDSTISLFRGRFQNFYDFENFHNLVKDKDSMYSPQNFKILGLESYTFNGYNNDDILENIKVLHTQPAIFSQYLIENSDEFRFVIEDTRESYLTFEPSKYQSTRDQIQSQVILTLTNDETTYFILCFDTSTNATNFASYISKFALPEPLLIPNELKNFLITRI